MRLKRLAHRMLMGRRDPAGIARKAIKFQCALDGNFRIQNRIGPGERDSCTHSGGVQKDNPFPTTWIGRWDDFELNSFVLHSRSLNCRRSESVAST
jgi:hypothetical protein